MAKAAAHASGETRTAALYLALLMAAAGLCGAAFWYLERHGLNPNLLFGDPAKATQSPFYLGVFSILGLLLWTASALLCGVGARLATSAGLRRFLAGGAALTLLLLVDDWLLLHDHVGPVLLHVPQKLFFAAYAALAGGWLLVNRRTVLTETPIAYLAAALVLGAASVFIDTRIPHTRVASVAEDSFKLLAIVSWTFYFARITGRSLQPRGHTAP
ncbi:MAG: hypothetical protein ABFS41_09525 [Myxococcota bacterium]